MLKKTMLQKILAKLARATVKKYQPKIIGITGSVGKTSTREAIAAVLKVNYRVRASQKNYNNEIGLPLAILGIPHYGKNLFLWCAAFARAWIDIVRKNSLYPEILILEYGIDHLGDMDYLLSLAKPDIAVVTAIGEIPVHVEFFRDAEEVAREKGNIVAVLPSNGCAILNHDDYAVYSMRERTHAAIMTFGREEHADLRMLNYELRITKDAVCGEVPEGISFKIEHKGHIVPVRLKNVFGIPQAYAALGAAAVGTVLGMNLVKISEALQYYIPPAGRLRLLPGIKHSFILDDTYNASPEAMREAIETLQMLPGARKIAVLGDMLEIGRYTEQAHRALGDKLAQFVDILFVVGPRAKFIADEALYRGIEANVKVLVEKQVFRFDDADAAGRALDPMIREGDLILVKGSQAMRMERVVREIMRYPERAHEFLVRQEKYWKKQ